MNKDKRMKEPIRIAHIMGNMNSGGVEAVVMNYYRAMDRTQVQFDFFVHKTSSFPQREEIERLGGRYYFLPQYTRVFSYHRTLKRLLQENKYIAVHSHINTMSFFSLFAAFRAGVPVRICHNHSTAYWGEGVKTLLKYMLRPFAKLFATDYFACGERAGRWMYGNRCFKQGKVHVLPNAVDIERYRFRKDARTALRQTFSIAEETLTIGHVGRYTYAKNHAFLLDIFAALHQEKPDSVLLLVGEGELETQIRKRIHALGLDDCVLLPGVRDDVNKIYSAMDVLCLPSYYEGMPVVLVEAQASGLPCVVSDRVTDEIKSLHLIKRLSISETTAKWQQALISAGSAKRAGSAEQNEFDVSLHAKRLTHFYLEKWDRWNERR